MNQVYLALGTNLGDKTTNLLRTIALIAEKIGVLSAISSIYETKPWGFESANNFLNQVVCVETLLQPLEILITTQSIEKTIGRAQKTDLSYQDRVIDIDLITYNQLIYKSKNLELPHPLFHQRQFVLLPMNEIAPDYMHPVLHKKIKQLVEECIRLKDFRILFQNDGIK